MLTHGKVLDYRFMSQLQATTGNLHVVVPFLSQSNPPATQAMGTGPRIAMNAVVGDILMLGPQREATVTQNSPRHFSFKEQLPLLQRVAHLMEFSQFRDKPNMTVFQHERRWRGSLLIYFLRRSGVATSSGDGWWGGVASLENAGTELIRRAVNEAWKTDSAGSIS